MMKEVCLNKAKVVKKLSSEPRNSTQGRIELEASEAPRWCRGTLKWNRDSCTGLPS